jgi:glutamyl-tRNA synthetase
MTRLRFAPATNSHLHVASARIALVTWLFAQRHKGEFSVWLDDLDLERTRPEFLNSISHDLRWMGLPESECLQQSARREQYDQAAERLKASGRLYPCFENEDELRFKRDMRIKRGQAPVYDRAMLRMTPEQRAAAEANGKCPYWRFRLTDTTVAWIDMVLGQQVVKLPSVSDPVMIRADDQPMHLFTNVVDDIAWGTTHVIRSADQLTATGIQIDLFSALGVNPTRLNFGHLPALTDTDGDKPSRRFDRITLRSLRADGIEPEAVAAYLARLGTAKSPAPASLDQLAASFDLSRFNQPVSRFDAGQLLASNRRVLADLPFAAVADRLPLGATEAFWNLLRGHLDLLTEARSWWEVVAGSILPPVLEDATGDTQIGWFRSALGSLPPEPWNRDALSAWIAGQSVQGSALRLTLTGEEHGPDLADLLLMMGSSRVAERLRAAVV